MPTIDELRRSDDWRRSVGLPVTKSHFREVDGTGHAVCTPSTGECEVHEDSVNPHAEPLKHLLHDAPELAVGLAATAVSLWWWKKKKLFL